MVPFVWVGVILMTPVNSLLRKGPTQGGQTSNPPAIKAMNPVSKEGRIYINFLQMFEGIRMDLPLWNAWWQECWEEMTCSPPVNTRFAWWISWNLKNRPQNIVLFIVTQAIVKEKAIQYDYVAKLCALFCFISNTAQKVLAIQWYIATCKGW